MTLIRKKIVRLKTIGSIVVVALVSGFTGCSDAGFLGSEGGFGKSRNGSKKGGIKSSGEQNCTPSAGATVADKGSSLDSMAGWSSMAATLKTHQYGSSSVWTGSHLIVWGGTLLDRANVKINYGLIPSTNFGEIYDPASDSWKALSETGAPAGRGRHTAVWTGSKMIVWGGGAVSEFSYNPNNGGFPTGVGNYLNDGAIYDPCTDTWSTISNANAPQARVGHIAVWTGSKMIVWGGTTGYGNYFSDTNTGGIYDPATDTWTSISTSNAPSPRLAPNIAWTGTELLVWGGCRLYSLFSVDCKIDGGLYNPETNTWKPMSAANGLTVRDGKNSVWTGSELIIWGGKYNRQMVTGTADSTATDTYYNTGFRYKPSSDTWTELSTTDAPSPREYTILVWTGSAMFAWGGIKRLVLPNQTSVEPQKDGSLYDPASNSWKPMNSTNGPGSAQSVLENQVAIWSGKSILLWKQGMKYTP